MTVELFDALSALCSMWNQYCPPPHTHMFMSAGEECEEILDKYSLLVNDKVDWDNLDKLRETIKP